MSRYAAIVVMVVLLAGCGPKTDESAQTLAARKAMVEGLTTAKVITDKALVKALSVTPRQKFISQDARGQAYADVPAAADAARYVPSPTACAISLEALQPRPGTKVLQVSLSDGYRPAVLAHIVGSVRIVVLGDEVASALQQEIASAGCTNVFVKAGDIAQGWPEYAPYDAILTDCDPNRVPEALVDQLKPNGRLVSVRGVLPRDLIVLSKDKRRSEMTLVATLPIPQSSFRATASAR